MLLKLFGIMLMLTLLVMAPGYGSAATSGKPDPAPATQTKGSEVKGKPAGAVKSYTPDERKEYVKKTAAELEEIDKQIGDLRFKATKAAPQRKRMMIMMMQNVYNQALVARTQLTNLEKAPENAWSGGKDSLEKSMQDLKTGLQAAAAQLK
jgi:hypothetical protein